jgi:DnaK suppressor protein
LILRGYNEGLRRERSIPRRRGGVACGAIAGYNAQFIAGGAGSGLQCRTSRRYEVHGWIKDMAAKTAVAVKKQPRELTEEEILKAPDKDYMNEAQLAFFRKRLEDIRDQILRNADDTGEHLRENEITTDPSDRATLEEEYTLELRTRDRERKLLKKVEKSLRMIEDGSYGYCEETGEPIGVPRLIARPMTTLSIEAQERRERVQKLYGD